MSGSEKSITVTGNEIIGGDTANFGIEIGTKGAIEELNISGNEVSGDFSSSAIHVDLGFKTSGEYVVAIENNNVDCTTGRGIYLGGVNNADGAIVISGNEIINDHTSGAIVFHNTCQSIGSLTINENAGIDMTHMVTTDAEIEVMNNKVISSGDVEPSVVIGYVPEDGSNNQAVLVEPETAVSTFYVDSAWAGRENGASVWIGEKCYILGTNAFSSFAEALKAVNETTGEIVISGEIAEDIPAEELVVSLSKNLTITGAEGSSITLNNGGYKALVFGAAEGAEDISVNFSGVNLTADKTQIIFGNTTTDEEGNLITRKVITNGISCFSSV